MTILGTGAVSVILPTHRRDHLLRHAIESVLCQTYRNFEVIVSDNAASAATEELVRSFGDARLRYRASTDAPDPLGNHVAGLRQAAGEFAAFLHDDNSWEPNFLERLVGALAQAPDCALVFCDETVMDAAGRCSGKKSDAYTRMWGRDRIAAGRHRPFWDLIPLQSIRLPCTLFRRAALSPDDIPPDPEHALDSWIVYLICRSGGGAFFLPERLVRTRCHDESETSHPKDLRLGSVWFWERVLAEPNLAPHRRAVERWAAQAHLTTASLALRRSEPLAARRHVRGALRHRIGGRAVFYYALSRAPGRLTRCLFMLWDEGRRRARATTALLLSFGGTMVGPAEKPGVSGTGRPA
jgi:glycosyltransferase involved in cell wall biosynthesis